MVNDHDPPAWLDREAYPFTSRHVRIPAGRIHYVEEGPATEARPPQGERPAEGSLPPKGRPAPAPTLLFVHGTPTWSFEWRHLIRGLSDRFRCVAPDHLGFGLSERPPEFPYTPEAHARNLRDFVRALELDDLTLVVHDFGGPIGLPLALEEGMRVRRLVLLNTWFWSFDGDRRMERSARVAGSRIGRWLYRRLNFSLRTIMPSAYGDRKRLTPEIHRQYLAPFPDARSRGTVLWTLARSLLGSAEHYEAIWQERVRLGALPTLVVWGTKDSAFPPPYLEKVRSALPDARVVELPVGHWPHEEAPDEVLEAMRGFLEEE